jgi:hypothetical protein
LPAVSEIAKDYPEIAFLAVAGRSSEEASADKAPQLFDENLLMWGYDDEVWQAYEVFSQPTVVLISSDDVILGGWFGGQPDSVIRDALDQMVVIG